MYNLCICQYIFAKVKQNMGLFVQKQVDLIIVAIQIHSLPHKCPPG